MGNSQTAAGWVYLLGAISSAGVMTRAPVTRSFAAEAADTIGLTEVVVTAQRREENWQ